VMEAGSSPETTISKHHHIPEESHHRSLRLVQLTEHGDWDGETEQGDAVVRLLICIRQVLSSNLGTDTVILRFFTVYLTSI
jgi:hypothetical protein